jgi:hypothetical protein
MKLYYQRKTEDLILNGILLCSRIDKIRECWRIENSVNKS